MQPAKAAPASQGSDKGLTETLGKQTANRVIRLNNDVMERQSAQHLLRSIGRQMADTAGGSAAQAEISE